MVIEISNMFDISPTLPDQAGNLQLTLTDHVNIGPDSPKMHSCRPVGTCIKYLHFSGFCILFRL